jgi:hypothetical protein
MSQSNEEPNILLEENSPNGILTAVVEEMRGVVYFYVAGPKETFAMKACWVRNTSEAPEKFEETAMKEGYPPRLTAEACAHPKGAPPLAPEMLRIVWMEEGDGAALFEGKELLAVIPGWAGINDFRGYARDCTLRTALCWPLKDAVAIPARVAKAETFWKSWEKGHWADLQPKFLKAYDDAVGKETKYFAADDGKWPPKAVARFEADEIVLLTLGMSIQLQPRVELSGDVAAPYRRIELGFAFARPMNDETALDMAVAYLSAQTNLPWYGFTWLGHGHTIESDPSPVGNEFVAMLLMKEAPDAPAIDMPTYNGDPISLLWMIPITAAERELAEKQGSEELIKRLRDAQVTYGFKPRASVA